jgi:TPR repeat protein
MKTLSKKATEAERLLGHADKMWDNGRLRSALRLMQSAARLGSSGAMVSLGYLYDCGIGIPKNRELAMYWYKRGYRNGETAGANNIGTIYRDERKSRLALGWFEKAIQPWNKDPHFEIAKIYINHFGDPKSAIRHLRLVVNGKPGVTVDEDFWKEAKLLLRKLTAKPKKHKRASR